MTPQLKVIWHLFNLCAIAFALAVRGSTGFSIFLSKETLSASPTAEAPNLSYIHSAAPFLNGSVVQPPLTSHPFESSPPGPENIQPFPQLPYPVTISPTHSVAASAPTDKSPAPDPSIKLAPSKEPTPDPEVLAPLPPDPEVPSHGLSPQNPAKVYASPPVVAPQASIPIHASSPPSATVPSHSSSLPPSTISPLTSVSPPPPLLPSKHASAPSIVAAMSPHASTTPTHPKTLHHFTSSPPFVPIENTPSADSAPPPSVIVPPVPPPIPAITIPSPVLVPPPTEKSHFLAPPPTSMPFISAQSPLVSSSPPQAAPSHPFAPSHFSAPPPSSIPYISAPPPNATISEHSPAPPPPTPPMLASNPPPDVGPPIVSPPPPPDTAPSHDLGPSHFLAPPPSSVPHISAPPPNATILENSPALPMHASNPPPDAAPSRHLASPPPAESHFSAPPPNATISEHSPAPPMHPSNPPPDVGPPIVSPPPPPDAAPSHDLASPPPAESHFSAPPPSSMHFPTPPTSSPASKNASSTAAEPPVAASPPSVHTATPRSSPPVEQQIKKPKSQSPPEPSKSPAPSVASPVRSPSIIPVVPREPPSITPEPQLPRVSSPAPSIRQRGRQVPVAVPPSGPTYSLSPTNHHPEQGISPYIAPSVHKSRGLPRLAPEAAHSPSFSPLPSTTKPHPRNVSRSAPETSYTVPSPAPQQHSQVDRPYSLLAPSPESTQRYHSPTSRHTAFAPSHSPSTEDYISPVPSGHSITPFLSPEISPSPRKPMLAPPILALPPPPPNRDCLSYTCLEPYTNTIAGSPCGCVLPMKVELQIGVALYTFFPLVPELAREVATGIFMKQSQVRIMGANAASEQPDKTLLMIDLVPLGDKFDNITAFLIYERFWNKQVAISNSLFGDYQVLNVQYPGLPPSPPVAPSDISVNNGDPYPGGNGSKMHPLGVDVTKQGRKHRLSGSLIAIIVLSAVGSLLLCFLLGWISLFRHRRQVNQSAEAPHVYPSSIARSTGPAGQSAGSRPSFSLSFESSVAAYTGSAKTFSTAEIEKATENFDSSRVLGEGGFGRVYSGVLEDGTEVAVKVLKRDDQQGGREFLAEVEMLSRLHHRNLVKLIGICVEEHARSLVYELVPNGSVESHLHGIDRQISPLDWAARMKIALGAARGLAYLHEDSSPRVIHRDFKASNILLEADFTAKVSDFGLARTAMDEENTHISTRVMGTFGYVAPEYAMTGHLLVKSDVYSYGVVLLELLTGRKPVDMSQPPGQENLVSWTRPYLTSKEALKSIVDPDLGPDISFDSVAKVAAIASMCVQPEVSHRPFMGEVVQALKLVCNECDSSKDECDENSSSCCDGNSLNEARDPSRNRNGEDLEKGLSASDMFSATDVASDSFRRHSSSGPIGGGRSWRFWKRARTTTTREDVGEHGMYRFWSGSH